MNLDYTPYNLCGGVKLHHQFLPEYFESVGIDMTMYTGSADDHVIGLDGVHHAFEHMPFRGTTDFPDGNAQLEEPFVKTCGSIGAYTGYRQTNYWAHVVTEQAEDAAHRVANMIGKPLLRDKDIQLELPVLLQEIRRRQSSLAGFVGLNFNQILWPSHPLGHHPIGDIESVSKLTEAHFRKVWETGYSLDRLVVFVSGHIKADTAISMIEKACEAIPMHDIGKRNKPVDHGPLPEWKYGERHEMKAPFAHSSVNVVYPYPAKTGIRNTVKMGLVEDMFSAGGSTSPLSQIVREQNSLVYRISTLSEVFVEGGYLGFEADTSADQIDKLISLINKVLHDPSASSESRFETVRSIWRNRPRMRYKSPGEMNDIALNRLNLYGRVMSDDSISGYVDDIQYKEVVDEIEKLRQMPPRIVIFRGK